MTDFSLPLLYIIGSGPYVPNLAHREKLTPSKN
jgi:hypothetical protein